MAKHRHVSTVLRFKRSGGGRALETDPLIESNMKDDFLIAHCVVRPCLLRSTGAIGSRKTTRILAESSGSDRKPRISGGLWSVEANSITASGRSRQARRFDKGWNDRERDLLHAFAERAHKGLKGLTTWIRPQKGIIRLMLAASSDRSSIAGAAIPVTTIRGGPLLG